MFRPQFLAIFRELVVFSRHAACMLAYLVRVYVLGAWSWVLLEKLPASQLVKKFPAFYGTRRFSTAFTTARHLSLSWTNSFQSMPPHPTSWRSTIILSFHLRLGLPRGLFPSGFPTKTLCTHLLFTIRASCHTHLVLLDLITRIIMDEEYRSLSSLIMLFLHSPDTFPLLSSNILLSSLYSNTLSLRPSLNVSDQVSHPYTTGKVIVPTVYIRVYNYNYN